MDSSELMGLAKNIDKMHGSTLYVLFFDLEENKRLKSLEGLLTEVQRIYEGFIDFEKMKYDSLFAYDVVRTCLVSIQDPEKFLVYFFKVVGKEPPFGGLFKGRDGQSNRTTLSNILKGYKIYDDELLRACEGLNSYTLLYKFFDCLNEFYNRFPGLEKSIIEQALFSVLRWNIGNEKIRPLCFLQCVPKEEKEVFEIYREILDGFKIDELKTILTISGDYYVRDFVDLCSTESELREQLHNKVIDPEIKKLATFAQQLVQWINENNLIESSHQSEVAGDTACLSQYRDLLDKLGKGELPENGKISSCHIYYRNEKEDYVLATTFTDSQGDDPVVYEEPLKIFLERNIKNYQTRLPEIERCKQRIKKSIKEIEKWSSDALQLAKESATGSSCFLQRGR